MKIKLVIFDFDGTIMDTRKPIVSAKQETMRRMGLPVLDEETCAATIGYTAKIGFLRMYPDMDDETADKCVTLYRKLFDEIVQTEPPVLFPKVLETLDKLQEMGMTCTIATSRNRKSLLGFLEQLGILGRFSYILAQEDTVLLKPDGEPVKKTLRDLSFRADEAIVVGDMPMDIHMGRNAGVHTCGVTYGNADRVTLVASGADFVIDSIDELIGIVEEKTQISNSRRFYENQVAPMIRKEFQQYEDRIAVGLSGEGSDCFGYDDGISRDHDFGTGVCLWLTDEDMALFGKELDKAYNDLIDRQPGNNLTVRLRERRGVMTIHDFYSKILGINCDVKTLSLSEEEWQKLDHSCLATATNGEVFRDDTGAFTAYRNMLLSYYPDRIWKIRIINELHAFSAALQVNYARCMSRDDRVAAGLCRLHGIESAMQLFFLLKRQYPPYYKWTYRRLTELDEEGRISKWIRELSETNGDPEVWEGRKYSPKYLNLSDPVVLLSERIAEEIVKMLQKHDLIQSSDPYLEKHVDTIIRAGGLN